MSDDRSALGILRALVQGVHPFTGDEIKGESVLQDAKVLRALLSGVAAMEANAVRDSRRKQLPANIGKAWTEKATQDMVDQFKTGVPLEQIAASHGRTLRAIEARLEKLGLITEEERKTTDRFGPNAPD